MNRRGVIYDVGNVFSGPGWRVDTRPRLDLGLARRELQIIRDDLHANAVRIVGMRIDRVAAVAGAALDLGLEAWCSPILFERSQEETLAHLVRAAGAMPRSSVYVLGCELSLFMQGIVPGRTVADRIGKPAGRQVLKAGGHNAPLNAFLQRAVEAVRRVFPGPLTYASLPFEQVDWTPFDIVGVDHYREARVKDRYVDMLQPYFATGKPVVVTELGMRTYRDADSSGALGFGIVDPRTTFLHQLPLVGRLFRERLAGDHVRDEALQARELAETLDLLEQAGVDGAFVSTFVNPEAPFDEDPRYDLDMSGMSLVKTYRSRKGATYPDMPWEPKESFRAVAAHYGRA